MLQLNPEFDSIGKQFVQHYYTTFRSQRDKLAELYTEQSMLTYENERFQGVAAIVAKLQKLPVAVKHSIITCDCQPTPSNGIIVLVAGDVAIEENPPMKFCQAFNLVPSGNGGYAVFNDVFRLCIG